MKTHQLLALNALVKAIAQHSAKLPTGVITLAPHIRIRWNKTVRLILASFEDYEKSRLEICNTHGKISADGKNYEFSGDQKAAFEAEMNALVAAPIEIDLPKFEPADFDTAELPPELLCALSTSVATKA